MNSGRQERILAILYEMALVIGSGGKLDDLVTRVLQKLMYHTGFPAGLALIREHPDDETTIHQVLGSHRLNTVKGSSASLPDRLASGPVALLSDLGELAPLLVSDRQYRSALILPMPRFGALILLNTEPPAHDLPLVGMFRSVLANFDRAIEHCLLRAAYTRSLVDEKEAATSALDVEKERALVTLRSIGDGVVTTNSEGCIEFVNPVAETITGWSAKEARGRPLLDVFQVEEGRWARLSEILLEQCLDGTPVKSPTEHTVLFTRNGMRRAIKESVAPIRTRDGDVIGAVMVLHDVTPERELLRHLEWQANHDTLTGLYSRAYFELHLRDAIDSAHAQGISHVLLYMDLDQFKIINDTSGHVAGDELLRQLGALLKRQLDGRGILARLGGDEFGLLLEQKSLDDGLATAEYMAETINRFRLVWEGQLFNIGVSIGVAVIDATSGNQTEVLSAADMSCYAAKESGRNRIQVYHPGDAEMEFRRKQMSQVARINQALEEEQFLLFRQAIAPVKTGNGASDHYEILLRMRDRSGRILDPGMIIPAAERYSLMPQIDRWVIHRLFKLLALARDAGVLPAGEIYSINLSGTSLGDERLTPYVKEQFGEFNIAPDSIGFEITETAAITNLEQTREFIHAMRDLGCHFSLDDFGSGLSSFHYLRELDVDFVKIDGAFVRDIATDPVAREIVAAIHNMVRTMGKRTVAEFVENEDILEILRQIGVDFSQGHGIQRPVRLPWCKLSEETSTQPLVANTSTKIV